MGSSGEAQNIAHQQKHMDIEAMRQFRDRFAIPIKDAELGDIPFYKPAEDSPGDEISQRAHKLGEVPQRRRKSTRVDLPSRRLRRSTSN